MNRLSQVISRFAVGALVLGFALHVGAAESTKASKTAKKNARGTSIVKEQTASSNSEPAASTPAAISPATTTSTTTTTKTTSETSASGTTTSGTTTTTVEQVTEKKSAVGITYQGTIVGPGFNNGPLKQPNASPLSIGHAVSVSPRIIDGLTTSILLGASTSLEPLNKNKYFTPADPALRLGVTAISAAGFNLVTELRYAAPVIKASRDQNTLGILQFRQTATYDVGDSGLSLAAIAHERFHMVRGSRATETRKNLSGWFTVGAEYKVLDSLAASAYYYAEGSNKFGTGLAGFKQDGAEFDLGFGWDITKSLNFNPFLVIPTSVRSAKDLTNSAQVAGILTAKIL